MKTFIFYAVLLVIPVFLVTKAANDNKFRASSGTPIVGTDVKKANSLEDKINFLKEKQGELKEKFVLQLEERWQKRCDFVTGRINDRIEKFNANKDLHTEQYAKLQTKIEEVLSKLEEKGYDVSSIAGDLDKLDTLIGEYATEYNTFIGLLEDTQDFVCGQSAGAFLEAVKAARDQLEVVHAKRLEIRDFYKNVIREDIKDLRNQKADLSQSKDSVEENEVENQEE